MRALIISRRTLIISRRALILPLCALIVCACQPAEHQGRVIRFWHFWSEPAQRKALESIIDEYERLHPGIEIESTELSWSDGKSKLQLAFNAGTEPDVIHLGLDWFTEFQRSRVFKRLPDSISANQNGLIKDTSIVNYAAVWCVNARALVAHKEVPRRFSWGLCATDAHNVMKRMLPLLWMLGAERFCITLDENGAISPTMDSSLVQALYKVWANARTNSLIERSRQLDEYLLNGELQQVFTGSWIIDMIHQREITFLKVFPQRSIVNGDVLAIGRNSKSVSDAADFTAFLTSYAQARTFCGQVSDAGFPAELEKAMQDTLFTNDELKMGFLETIKLSSPLPFHPKMLSIEPIIEDMIVRCYTAKSFSDVASIVAEARRHVAEIEN